MKSLKSLWHLKNQLSSSCNKDIRQLVERVNKIAQEQGFEKTVKNQQNRKIA